MLEIYNFFRLITRMHLFIFYLQLRAMAHLL